MKKLVTQSCTEEAQSYTVRKDSVKLRDNSVILCVTERN